MKVYVITKGIYEDYTICGVSVDEAAAEKIRKYFSDDEEDAQIEVFDTFDMIPIIDNTTRYVVRFDYSGKLVSVREDRTWLTVDKKESPEIKNLSKILPEGWLNMGYEVTLWADDPQDAFNHANDILVEYRRIHFGENV